MLRNVLEGYLGRIKEREFDLPLLLLLPALGYYDVHFTHGPVEFGKDIIAKKREDGIEVQFSFQSKAGNITQSTWRNEIQGQIHTALLSGLSHPSFDRNLPRHVVVLTTGELKSNATIETQEFQATVKGLNPSWSVSFWDKRDLIDMLLEHGLNGVHRATAAGFVEFGQFFLIYARALQGVVTVREIETYSRTWESGDVDRSRRLLLGAIEAEVLAQLCLSNDLAYEAAQLHLARIRLLCELSYAENSHELPESWDEAVGRLYALCATYIGRFQEAWEADRDLVKVWFGEVYMTTYPVQCLRIMELASLAYFTTDKDDDRARHAAFLADFVRAEPGCAHPISDRFAISLVLATLVLIDRRYLDEAAALIEKATVWLCDRYQDGMGLAGVEADEQAETSVLLGYAFEFVDVSRRRDSFLTTALMDLAAFLGNAALYSDVVNDVKAVRIYAEYWQPRDTVGACRVEGHDVVHVPGVGFADDLLGADQGYAEHLAAESASFRFVELFGVAAAVAIMALLRDRYFPKLWPILAPNHTSISQ